MEVSKKLPSRNQVFKFICLIGFSFLLMLVYRNILWDVQPGSSFLVSHTFATKKATNDFADLIRLGFHTQFGSILWRTFYPEVNKLLSLIEDGKIMWPVSMNSSTSAKFTKLLLKENIGGYTVGDTLVATIEAKDGLGQRKTYGGDYFFARLMKTNDAGEILTSGIACDVVDQGDGTYTVSVPLLWPGRSTLFADLVHPSEAIVYLVNESASGFAKGIHFVSTYPSGEEVYCNVGLQPSSSLCD
uniref:Uncharacterized protein n=1 Tax=Ciona savignyi TaxID=51511 RepID=H2Y920_CIOSA